MTVFAQHVAICDFCGKSVRADYRNEVDMGVEFIHPRKWLSFITGNKRVWLCSWKCAADYAARNVGKPEGEG